MDESFGCMSHGLCTLTCTVPFRLAREGRFWADGGMWDGRGGANEEVHAYGAGRRTIHVQVHETVPDDPPDDPVPPTNHAHIESHVTVHAHTRT
ncbi:hypothetical protein SETIT_4G075100v2 [Setaria italica]|uniref:Uncharacterized protein n=1 Tax=Setaria italica TaxID=4555 RepID=A0A368QRT7_SETIT|nr:hypothetical protein SETIT_4G075100v2 [Setaria italica]